MFAGSAFVSGSLAGGYDVPRSGLDPSFCRRASSSWIHTQRFPLPKNWPQSIKTAVLHVISLAHVAIVRARCIVVNSPDARTRLVADLRGSLDEIRLLGWCRRDRHASAPSVIAIVYNSETANPQTGHQALQPRLYPRPQCAPCTTSPLQLTPTRATSGLFRGRAGLA
jgi:hypothetical protein